MGNRNNRRCLTPLEYLHKTLFPLRCRRYGLSLGTELACSPFSEDASRACKPSHKMHNWHNQNPASHLASKLLWAHPVRVRHPRREWPCPHQFVFRGVASQPHPRIRVKLEDGPQQHLSGRHCHRTRPAASHHFTNTGRTAVKPSKKKTSGTDR